MMLWFSDSVVAGAISGGVTRLLIEPLDVLKVRFQLQLEAIRKVHATSASVFLFYFYFYIVIAPQVERKR